MAPTDVARVIPSSTSPDPAKLVKWTDKPTGCLSIAAWVAFAFVLQEFCVTRVSYILILARTRNQTDVVTGSVYTADGLDGREFVDI